MARPLCRGMPMWISSGGWPPKTSIPSKKAPTIIPDRWRCTTPCATMPNPVVDRDDPPSGSEPSMPPTDCASSLPAYVGEKRLRTGLEIVNDGPPVPTRYRGHASNIWRCQCGHTTTVGSRRAAPAGHRGSGRFPDLHGPMSTKFTSAAPVPGRNDLGQRGHRLLV